MIDTGSRPNVGDDRYRFSTYNKLFKERFAIIFEELCCNSDLLVCLMLLRGIGNKCFQSMTVTFSIKKGGEFELGGFTASKAPSGLLLKSAPGVERPSPVTSYHRIKNVCNVLGRLLFRCVKTVLSCEAVEAL